MKKFLLSLALLVSMTMYAEPRQIHMAIDPTHTGNGDNPRSPIVVPVLYIDGYTLTAGDNTLGTTIQILDEDDEVVFSTYVAIEGEIQLPSTLSGTYTIQVISGDLTFIGEIEL